MKNETAVIILEAPVTPPTASGAPGILAFLPYLILLIPGLLGLILAENGNSGRNAGFPLRSLGEHHTGIHVFHPVYNQIALFCGLGIPMDPEESWRGASVSICSHADTRDS